MLRDLVSKLDMNTMSDEYKDRYLVYCYNIAEDPSSVLQTIQDHHMSFPTELD